MQTIRFKTIRPVYEDLEINEPLPDYLTETRRITSSKDVYALFKHLAREIRETFYALHLSSKNEIICLDKVSVGSLSASIVHPSSVLSSALLSSAAALICVHQHPSGHPDPSKEDIELSNRLKECCELLGMRMLDHVIIGNERYVSLADRGLI